MYSQTKYQVSIDSGKHILKEYYFCNSCTRRLFLKKFGLASNKIFKKTNKTKSSLQCYICKNILTNLKYYVNKMIDVSSEYSFSTFVVGAILKPSIIDRDDFIRSKFRLQGIDSIKTAITHQLGKQFAKKTKTKINNINPDLTFTINFKDDSCELKSKPLLVFGRYTKRKRGISQTQKPCDTCKGKGCISCNYHGLSDFSSVEGRLTEFFIDKVGSIKTKLTCIGGEDNTSLVLGKGRPFFIKLLNPRLRQLKITKKSLNDGIEVKSLKIITQIPKTPIPFTSDIELLITTKNPLTPSNLKILKKLLKTPITIYEKPVKLSQKFIHKLKYKKLSQNSFLLRITADGGIPIKRLVEGKNIEPSVTGLLENQCACDRFDFFDINFKGKKCP